MRVQTSAGTWVWYTKSSESPEAEYSGNSTTAFRLASKQNEGLCGEKSGDQCHVPNLAFILY